MNSADDVREENAHGGAASRGELSGVFAVWSGREC